MENENIFMMDENRAMTQDIRPLHISFSSKKSTRRGFTASLPVPPQSGKAGMRSGYTTTVQALQTANPLTIFHTVPLQSGCSVICSVSNAMKAALLISALF